MKTKELAFQSFERNQSLLESINKVLIHLKLSTKGVDDKIKPEEIEYAKNYIAEFMKKLEELVGSVQKNADPLTGIDLRYRNLIRKYVDAKSHNRFKSALFKSSPEKVRDLIYSTQADDHLKLIESLSEFRKMIQSHGLSDVRELMGDI
jgi:hypothetical protein